MTSTQPTYTDEQMSRYLLWIGMEDLQAIKTSIQDDPLGVLTKLMRKNMAAIPFGSVALHYSQFHGLTLDPEALYVKLVDRHLGGYCMENNGFFGTVLRSLGYRLYATGARISYVVDAGPGGIPKDPEGFKGWCHMINLVLINGRKYHVDVGFGAQGATAPNVLEENQVMQTVPTSETRLVFKNIPQYADSASKVWVLEMRDTPQSPWKPAYCFTEHEFIEDDFNVMNFFTSKNQSSMFTYRLILVKLILGEHDEPIGTLSLTGGEVKKRLQGKSEVVDKFEDEPGRVKGLEKWFDIKLRPEEIRGISGMVTELRPAGS